MRLLNAPQEFKGLPMVLSRWLFLRGLAIVFGIAFLSLAIQIKGLIGSRGIWPAAKYLASMGERLPSGKFFDIPSFFWLRATDGFLVGAGVVGILLSVLLLVGFAPRWTLLALWSLYLSFASVSGVFLGYQWDILLLEASLLAAFFAPPGLWPRLSQEAPVPRLALWLLRWLLFRVMFLSGLVKLLSGDPTWRNLTALRYHYWTQPLPAWTSYYVQHLPNIVHDVCTALMFVIELLVPLLIFTTRTLRWWSAVILTAFQLIIALTGNYGFFNLLTIVLCITLVDDARWRRLIPQRWRARLPASQLSIPPPGAGTLSANLSDCPTGSPISTSYRRRALRITGAGIAGLVVLVSVAEMRFWRRNLPDGVERILSFLQPFRSINSYGLFAVMTTTRPEIILEGSSDGSGWNRYDFKWKPGRMDEPAHFVAPHQPRLDWQMWFAALGSCRGNPWFLNFLARLLEGSPEVVRLLSRNPFADLPPVYIRSTLYEYRFSEWDQWRNHHIFWEREKKGPYCPTVTLSNGSLTVAHPE